MPSDVPTRLTQAVMLAVREHGYAGTSMQDLLRDTGVSSSSLYHFFPGGKEALVAEAVRARGLDAAERIRNVLERLTFVEAIERIFTAAATEMRDHDFSLGCAIGVPATEAPADSGAIREAVAEVFDAWCDAYAGGLRAAGFDAGEAEPLARFIVAAYEGSVTLARATRTTDPYRDAISAITAVVAR